MAKPPPSQFAIQADRAGLILPHEHRLNPRIAAVLVVGIILGAIGVGDATGWLNPHVSSTPYSLPSGCASPLVLLNASIPTDSPPQLVASFANLSSQYLLISGGCIASRWNVTSGSDPLGPLRSRVADLAVLNSPPNATALATMPAVPLVYPTAVGAVELVYNLPGFNAPLRLDSSALAAIYLGEAHDWNSPSLLSLNPALASGALPPLAVVYRADPNTANSEFGAYLSQTNATWRASVGSGKAPSWPTGVGVAGASGEIGYIAGHPGSIGFVTRSVTLPSGVAVAELQNSQGQFALPNTTGMGNAAVALLNSTGSSGPDSWNLSAATFGGNWSYPLTTFAYVVVFGDLTKAYGGTVSRYAGWWLLTFLEWAAHDGQSIPESFGFAPLPPPVVNFSNHILADVTYNGTSVLAGGSEGGESGGETGIF